MTAAPIPAVITTGAAATEVTPIAAAPSIPTVALVVAVLGQYSSKLMM